MTKNFSFFKKNLGKFTISAGNTIMPTYTAELYPTSIRNIGVGACNVAAGMALILTPALSELVWWMNILNIIIQFKYILSLINLYIHVYVSLSRSVVQNIIGGHWLMTLLTAWSCFGGFIILFLPNTIERAAQPSTENEER